MPSCSSWKDDPNDDEEHVKLVAPRSSTSVVETGSGSSASSRAKAMMVLLLVLIFLFLGALTVFLLSTINDAAVKEKVTQTAECAPLEMDYNASNSVSMAKVFAGKEPKTAAIAPVVFAHVHMARTGGSVINQMMAAKYRGVCGNKGYSFDNYRVRADVENHVSREQYPDGLKANTGKKAMEDIGFEECDFIILEEPAEYLVNVVAEKVKDPIVFLVPCRDPLQHLMSMCNFKQIDFNCNNTKEGHQLKTQVEKCIGWLNRFDIKLFMSKPDRFSIMCFDPIPPQRYVDFMGQLLLPQRMEFPYVRHRTDDVPPRDKENECIWKDPSLQARVLDYLMKTYDYFPWCQECMATEDNILLHHDD